MSVVKSLHNISHSEVSRAILNATVALAHVISYQTWNILGADTGSGVDIASACLDVLLRELQNLNPLVADAVKNSTVQLENNKRQVQWVRFCEESTKADSVGKSAKKKKMHDQQIGRSGVKFVEENGFDVMSVSPQKASSTRKTSSSLHMPEKFIKAQGLFSHQFFSHWLDVLVAATDAKISREAIVKSPDWITTIFLSIGIKVDVAENGKISNSQLKDSSNSQLPGRYRCRILRILYPILDAMTPSESLIRSLFDLAGSSCTTITLSLDEDEGMVSRETVSLLRRLHSPTQMSWRACINNLVHQSI